MSLNRVVLRLAVLAAASNMYRAPWPTLAGPMIYDSKIEPNEQLENKHAMPVAVVYTDYDKDFPRYKQLAYEERLVTITVEFLVVQASETTPEGSEVIEYTLETPTTDAELEVTLDQFEGQFFDAIFGDSVAADCVKSLAMGIKNVISRRGASIEGGQRLAARQLTIEVKMPRDPLPGNVPPYIEAFLQELIDTPVSGMSSVAEQVLDRYRNGTMPTSFVGSTAHATGLSKDMGDMLGLTRRTAPLLRTPISFLDPQGRPLWAGQ